MKDETKTNEIYVPLSRALLEHLTEIGRTALQIYIYLLLKAQFRGKGKGTVKICIREIADDLNLHRQTIWKTIKEKLIGKYLEMTPAKNQHNMTEFKIIDYRAIRDISKPAVSPKACGKTDNESAVSPETFGGKPVIKYSW